MATILLIEDEEFLRDIFQTKCKEAGLDFITAKDGEEGLITALSKRPDVILLDLGLPKIEGMSLLHQLRSDPWGKTVPVLILTNYDLDDTKLQGVVQDQPAYYMLKAEHSPDEIIERIKTVLHLS